jgi:methionine synthase II (cobalamin-independent)
MPGTDPLEAARVVFGELPDFPYLPELPDRGLGADVIGRTAGLLVDIAVEVMPTGYRVTARPGKEHRRGVDLLRRDLDAVEETIERTGVTPRAIKVQAAGPWTLTSGIELVRGHRSYTDPGALREFTQSLCEGLRLHVGEVARRTGLPVVVQLDEPSLPAVLAGHLPTPSGYGTIAPVGEPEATATLATVIDAARAATGQPVIVHCCAPRPPIALFGKAGANGLALDTTLLAKAPTAVWDELGETWERGTTMFLGLVPTLAPPEPPDLKTTADPALHLADRLGFAREWLADHAVPTPTCGLAGATPTWARAALTLTRELSRAFREPPESW